MLWEEAPNLRFKLEHPRRRYLTVPALACQLGVDHRQIYCAVERGTRCCRSFGRKIVFPPMLWNELFGVPNNVDKSI
jgi:hypothetical protein